MSAFWFDFEAWHSVADTHFVVGRHMIAFSTGGTSGHWAKWPHYMAKWLLKSIEINAAFCRGFC